MKIYMFLAPAETKLMQPILLSCEALFLSSGPAGGGNTGPERVMTLTGRVSFVFKLLLYCASHDTKIGCICSVWAGAQKYKFCYAQAL